MNRFDDFFVDRKFFNPMEKKKLERLDKANEDAFEEYRKAGKEMEKIRKEIPDNSFSAKNRIREELKTSIDIISSKMRELRIQKKEVIETANMKIRNLNAERRVLLSQSDELNKAKEVKAKLWENVQEKSSELHKYYRHLIKKQKDAEVSKTEPKEELDDKN